MMENFSNTALNISELPKIEELEFTSLHKNYLKESLVIRVIVLFPLVIGVYFLQNKNETYALEIILAALVFALVFIFFGYLSFFKKKYALRQKDVSYRRGILFHSITTVPLSRIQHSELMRGPLDRFYGLSSVKIFTAGGSSSDITIPGLSVKTAEQMREFINNKVAEDEQQ